VVTKKKNKATDIDFKGFQLKTLHDFHIQ